MEAYTDAVSLEHLLEGNSDTLPTVVRMRTKLEAVIAAMLSDATQSDGER